MRFNKIALVLLLLFFLAGLFILSGCNWFMGESEEQVPLDEPGLEEEVAPGEIAQEFAGADRPIIYNLSSVSKTNDSYRIRGWGFIEGLHTEGIEHYVVLRDEDDLLIFNAEHHTREDVTEHFSEMGLNLDHSGFRATIPREELTGEEYEVGFYFVVDGAGGVEFLGQNLSYLVSGEEAYISTQKDIDLEDAEHPVKYRISSIQDSEEHIDIRGWGFLEFRHTEGIEHYILLRHEDEVLIFDTEQHTREDVTEHYSEMGINLDQSGFRARIPKELLPEAEYEVGFLLIVNETRGLLFTNQYLQIE